MIFELKKNDYEKVRSLFKGLNYHLVIFSIIEGNSPGRVYVDNVDHPQSAFVWDYTEGGFYLAGDENNEEFNQSLNQCILEEIYPASKEIPRCVEFVLNYHPDTWENKLDIVLRNTNAIKHFRKHFFLKELKVDWRSMILDGFEITQVDEALLSRTQLKNMDHVTGWVMGNWQSVENFMEKGFGFCLLHNDTIVSWCIADYAAGNDTEMPISAEIGIHTDEDYQKRGFATLTVAATVDYCLTHGFKNIGWHCWSSNEASVATAMKVGFEQIIEHPVYHAWYNPFDNLLVQGWFYIQRQEYQAAAEAYEAAFAMLDDGAEDALASHIFSEGDTAGWCYYNTARAWALTGDSDAAFRNIYKAVDKGWSHPEHLKNDDAFEKLHHDNRWSALLKSV
jgi:RimJ/RimL family protein N-acetyltransferase